MTILTKQKTLFEQIVTAEDSSSLTQEQRSFLCLHNEIQYSARKVVENFISMAEDLKQMKDRKLYLSAGFTSFGEYTEGALNIKERQAYNYISVLEKLPEDFLQLNAKIGVTKLALLTSLTASEREELTERVNVDEATVKDLNEEIKRVIAERDEAQKQLTLLTSENQQIEDSNKMLEAEYVDSKKKLAEVKKEHKKLKEEKAALEKALEEAKEKALTPEIKTEYIEDEQGKKELATRIEKVKELELRLKEKEAQLDEAKAKKNELSSNTVVAFKVKFEDWQRIAEEMGKIIDSMSEETALKCRKACAQALEYAKEVIKL